MSDPLQTFRGAWMREKAASTSHEGSYAIQCYGAHAGIETEGELRSQVKQGHVALIGLDINYLW